MSNLGLMLGTIFITALCDRIGRKVMFQWVVLLYCFGDVDERSGTEHVRTMLIGRFMAGCGLGCRMAHRVRDPGGILAQKSAA